MREGGSDPKGEPSFKQSPPLASSPIHPRKGGADWLGLKDDDLDLLPPSPVQKAQQEDSAVTPSLPTPTNQHSAPESHSALTGLSSATKPPAKGTRPSDKASQASSLKASEEKEDDWLSHVISQKKSQSLAREERAEPSKGLTSLASLGQTPSSRYELGLIWLVERIWQDLRLALPILPVPSSARDTAVGINAISALPHFLAGMTESYPGADRQAGAGNTHALTAMGTVLTGLGKRKQRML